MNAQTPGTDGPGADNQVAKPTDPLSSHDGEPTGAQTADPRADVAPAAAGEQQKAREHEDKQRRNQTDDGIDALMDDSRDLGSGRS